MPLLTPGLCPLLTQNVVEKLATHGMKTVIDFVCTEPEKVTSQCEIPHKTVLSIRRVLLAQYSSFPLNGANLFDQSVATISILSTGCPELDDLLCYGIFTGEVTELRGPAASGKSQLCTYFSVKVAEVLQKNVIYIDGNNGFSPERAAQISKGSSEEKRHFSETLSRVRVCKCKSISHLFDILSAVRGMLTLAEDGFAQSLKAIIVDPITAILDPTLADASYADGQSLLTLAKKELNSLAKDFTLAVIVVTAFDTMKENRTKDRCPMGYTWSTAASTQLYLQRQTGLETLPVISQRPIKVTVTKSPRAEIGSSVTLDLTKYGLFPT